VSTREQADGYSLEAQEIALREYAKNLGYDIDDDDIFRDTSSGEDNERECFWNMLIAAEKKKYVAVLATEADRLSRDDKFLAYVEYRLLQKGTKFVIQNEMQIPEVQGDDEGIINTSLDIARYAMRKVGSIETKYRRIRIKRALQVAREQKRILHKAPLGYDNADKLAGIIYPPPNDYAKLIVDIFTDRANGMSLNKISTKYSHIKDPDFLKKSHHKGRRNKKSDSLLASVTQVFHILNNKFYAGFVKQDGQWVRGNHIPIITIELFDRVEAMSHKREKQKIKNEQDI
jgi:DNA invertase Pin-like site-specific DNA recombinase